MLSKYTIYLEIIEEIYEMRKKIESLAYQAGVNVDIINILGENRRSLFVKGTENGVKVMVEKINKEYASKILVTEIKKGWKNK